MALKLFAGKGHTRTYPTTPELLRFGKDVRRVAAPHSVLARIAQAMDQTLAEARTDERIPPVTRAAMAETWAGGLSYTQEGTQTRSAGSHGRCSEGR